LRPYGFLVFLGFLEASWSSRGRVYPSKIRVSIENLGKICEEEEKRMSCLGGCVGEILALGSSWLN